MGSTRRAATSTFAVVGYAAATACGRNLAGGGSETPGTEPGHGTPAPAIPPDAVAAANAALADAATRLGVPRANLRVDRVEPREWSDASLGCPEPGHLYAQVITPGYLLVISATGGGQSVEYHADTASRIVTC
jgi:hypothetical protein